MWRTALRLVNDVVGVITFYFFLGASQFVVFQSGSPLLSHPVNIGRAVMTQAQLINYAVALPPLITLFVMFIDGLIEVARLFGRRRATTTLAQHSNGIL